MFSKWKHKKRSEKCIISHLACIFGIYFCQVSELPGLLSLVEVPLVRFFHFYYFNLDRPLCGNWKSKKKTNYLKNYFKRLLILTHYLQPFIWWLPVAHKKQFFFFFPALQTLTMPRRRSSLGVKMSLWRACFMAVMMDAVIQRPWHK